MRRIGSLGVVLCVCGLLLAACDSGLFESTGVNLSNGEVASACNVLAGVNYARMRHLRTFEGHTRAVQAVAFSPDSKMIASGSWDRTVKLWDVSTANVIRTFVAHGRLGGMGGVTSVAFSPDGVSLASAGDSTSVKLWEVSTGRKVRTVFWGDAEKSAIGSGSVSFSPDGSTLVSARGRSVKVNDVSTGLVLRTFEENGGSVAPCAVAFSPDGKTLAMAGLLAILWRTSNGALLQEFVGLHDGLENRPRCLAFSPDGKTLAVGRKKTINFWETATGREIRTLEGHTRGINSVAFSPDGKTLASASDDKTVMLWSVSTGNLLHTLEGHTASVTSVAFSPDGMSLASGSYDATIRLWSVAIERERDKKR